MKSKLLRWIPLVTAAVLVGLDQLFKQLILTHLKPVSSISVIPHFLNLTYVENRGAAFGILQGQTIILVFVVAIFLAAILYFLISGKIRSTFLIWTLSLILAGGVGNLIDRISRGYVVDYLDIGPLFSFPVFNFADCCVVVGAIMLIIYMLFLDGKKDKKEISKEENSGTDSTDSAT